MAMVTAECWNCGATLKWWPQFYYLQHRIRCHRCGEVTTVRNPRIPPTRVTTGARAKLCVECRLPLPPPIKGRAAFSPKLSNTCPTCWDKHRIDEPAEDIGDDILRWVRSKKGKVDKTPRTAMISQTSSGTPRGNGGSNGQGH